MSDLYILITTGLYHITIMDYCDQYTYVISIHTYVSLVYIQTRGLTEEHNNSFNEDANKFVLHLMLDV